MNFDAIDPDPGHQSVTQAGHDVVITHIQLFSRFETLLSFKPAITKWVS